MVQINLKITSSHIKIGTPFFKIFVTFFTLANLFTRQFEGLNKEYPPPKMRFKSLVLPGWEKLFFTWGCEILVWEIFRSQNGRNRLRDARIRIPREKLYRIASRSLRLGTSKPISWPNSVFCWNSYVSLVNSFRRFAPGSGIAHGQCPWASAMCENCPAPKNK